MRKLANNIFIAVALLLSQTAFALHDIQHLDEVHNESCQVCTAQDQSACSPISQYKLDRISYKKQLEIVVIDVSLQDLNSLYLSRAPPHTL